MGVEIGRDRPWFEGCQLGEDSNIQYTIQSPFVCSKFSIIKSFFNFFIMLLGIKKVKFLKKMYTGPTKSFLDIKQQQMKLP